MDFFGIGSLELVLILIIILVFVGPAKLPEIAGFLGRTMRKFREASAEMNRSLKEISDEVQQAGKDMSDAALGSETSVASELKGVKRDIEETVGDAKTSTKSGGGLTEDLKEVSREISDTVNEAVSGQDTKASSPPKKTRGGSPKST